MAVQPKSGLVELVDEVSAIIVDRAAVAEGPTIEAFARVYYAGTSIEDLSGSAVEDLYGAVLAHWNFARVRQPGQPKVRVYNPMLEKHGWQSTHTIVEIVTDDMPFLVDSVRMSLNARTLTSHLVIHPVMRLRRDSSGKLVEVLEHGVDGEGAITEAVMHIEVDRQAALDVLQSLEADVRRALDDVRAAVEDWATMREHLRESIDSTPRHAAGVEPDEVAEGIAFLEWADNNHFTFLGCRDFAADEKSGELQPVPGSGLGLLRDGGATSGVTDFASTLPKSSRGRGRAELMVITKADSRSTVHRPGYMDCIALRQFSPDGDVIGERRFIGLYTSAAYNRVPRDIPYLRRKVEAVVEAADYPRNSHAAKALEHILDTFPRDLLFQVDTDAIRNTALGILHLQERQRIRLFVHPDRFGRFFSCIVYVPRERFNTQIRLVIQGILEETFHGKDAEFTVELSESVLARLYFVIRTNLKRASSVDLEALEERLREVSRSWSDDLSAALLEHCGEERGTALLRRYQDAFGADYRETYSARLAVHDIEKVEALSGAADIGMSLYRPLEAPINVLRFKLIHLESPVSLSDALPMLENMGLRVEDEHPSKIERADDVRVWLHDFGMVHGEGEGFELDRVSDIFQEAFARIWRGEVENDGFNRLVLRARLGWREVAIIRAYCKYLRQAGNAFSQEYMEHTLAANPAIARLLIDLFLARFDPAVDGDRSELAEARIADIRSGLDEVSNLDQDRILRSFLDVIRATLRTNYFQRSAAGAEKDYMSFKFDPKRIPGLPEPRPTYEIFVYSPRVEAVHLRGGSVARGGIRWSDRREDFRTEVLGLVKAQIVKNAVIVPVGSKGGFVPKQLPDSADREAFQREGIECYKTFMRGMLDITDNIVHGEVVAPTDVVRHDSDDPYLVVAADKGTATFSDIANGVAAEFGFWLGDAFASGGSQGYDHKGMGITARGAWESVKRNFRELGVDTQTTDFTVVGIGDMSGDVFGNGMLLSPHIKLIGAFNHLHIFFDPDPDTAASFRERQRMFSLPRSTWDDYDRSLISKGGGVFSRSAKSIVLTPEMRTVLDVDAESLTPTELISAMLGAKVDLLWNGGIGTYVKSSEETNAEVGDRANDALRVNGDQLRCRVVGEGGNLGLTQLGRIEYALNGGRICTDAIDNSGGVDCSDHEVNIKILLNEVVGAGDMTVKQRNVLLAEMTDEVGELVLRNNYLQTQALSVAGSQSASLLDVHARLIKYLGREVGLDRDIEYLPSVEEIAERAAAKHGLVAPELSVLLAYVKIGLFQQLLESRLPDESFVVSDLRAYFPSALRDRFAEAIPHHRLAREIISTVVANEMVNRCGISFTFRLGEETGAGAADIARAYVVARDVFEMKGVWDEIESLDNRVPAATQTLMNLESRKLVERSARWLLRNRARPLDIAANVEYFATPARVLADKLRALISSAAAKALDSMAASLVECGVPEALAQRIALLNESFSVFDIADVASSTGTAVDEVASVHFALGESLDLHWLRDRIVDLPRDNRWQALSRAALRDDLFTQLSVLTADVLRTSEPGQASDARIEHWMKRNTISVRRVQQILNDIRSAGSPDFTMLSVAMGEIRSLRQVDTGQPAARKPTKKRKGKG